MREIKAFGKHHDMRQTAYRAVIPKDRWETIRQELEAAGKWWISCDYPIEHLLLDLDTPVVAGNSEVVFELDPYRRKFLSDEPKSLFVLEMEVQAGRDFGQAIITEFTTLN